MSLHFVAGGVSVNRIIVGELPTPAANGVIVAFSAANAYVAGTLAVYRDGLRMQRGADYTETTPSTGAFTLAVAPDSDEELVIDYIKA